MLTYNVSYKLRHNTGSIKVLVPIMKKKFTQGELERAYDQMEDERNLEAKNASEAAAWVGNELGMEWVQVRNPRFNTGGSSKISPVPENYVITCIYTSYDLSLEDYVKKLDVVPWAKKNDEWVFGYRTGTPFYDVDTPYGKFKLTFEYHNSHVGGY